MPLDWIRVLAYTYCVKMPTLFTEAKVSRQWDSVCVAAYLYFGCGRPTQTQIYYLIKQDRVYPHLNATTTYLNFFIDNKEKGLIEEL